MVTWIKIEIKSRFCDKSVKTSAILNTGFGFAYPGSTPSAVLRIPKKLAEILCLTEEVIKNSGTKEVYESATEVATLDYIPRAVEVSVIAENRASKTIICDVLIGESADTILLNDKAISELEIIILDPAKGLWMFRGEKTERQSAEPEFW